MCYHADLEQQALDSEVALKNPNKISSKEIRYVHMQEITVKGESKNAKYQWREKLFCCTTGN